MSGTSSAFAKLLRERGYRHDGAANVWHREDPSAFAYSDGDETEQRIAAAIAQSPDVSLFSADLRRHMTDWASTYHLSPTRANLLRPLSSLLQGARVLEVGAGCGAITRYLGEQGAQVLALEGSFRRASMVASRCRDLDNVAVLNERFGALATQEKFDVVTLVGVLEYARIYTEGADPILETLRHAHALLNDEGVLVVAIENQLGLKYFAGVPEDHLGRAMAGIQDQYDERSVVTFGKVELESRLASAGFAQSECAIPLPDYKLPQSVVLPLGLRTPDFNAGSLAGQATMADRQIVRSTLFSLGRAFDVIARNQLLEDLSNSFLILARKSAHSPSFGTVAPQVLAEQYSSSRAPAFTKQSRFVLGDEGIRVERQPLCPGARADSKLLSQSLPTEPYLQGTLWVERLESILTKPGWTLAQVAGWLRVWRDALATLLPGSPDGSALQIDTPVPGELIDAIPRNLQVAADGTASFFDLEWSYKAPITYGYLTFRAVKISLGAVTGVVSPEEQRMLHVPTLIRELFRESGLVITNDRIQAYLDLEAMLRAESLGEPFAPLDFSSFQQDVMGLLPDVDRLLSEHSGQGQLASIVAGYEAQLETLRGNSQKLMELLDTHAALVHDHQRTLADVEQLHKQAARATAADRGSATEKDFQDKVEQIQKRLLDASRLEQLTHAQAKELDLIKHSLSWSITRPLRSGAALARRARSAVRRRGARLAERAYRAAPISHTRKRALKNILFSHTRWLIGRTGAYQRWAAYERTHASTPSASSAEPGYTYDQAAALPPGTLWPADGTREWVDYQSVRERIDAEFTEQRLAKQPKTMAMRDFSGMEPMKAAERIRLPEPPQRPEVTILVPVFNHLTTTLECLASIAETAGRQGPTFEVLIADDASTDTSAHVLGSIRHLRVVSQTRNLGFLRNCNAAAREARGRLLVLLNNDVQVTTGWLEALVKCIDQSPDIGAVGPKIAYPSGWLQEAGTALHADGTSDMVGLNDLPDLARYAFDRDVDYCSGACLMIRTDDFARLGGFDESYAPAYCEDSDLCMRLRSEGRRIVYCAQATILHHLSRTSDGLQSDYKLRCVSTNLAKFTSRWQAELDRMDDVRTIAFYLPQFHPFPENDLWWGQGFTEWTNVTKARPNYVGHYQPRMPADLGYYDLRVTETMERQAELARRYGLSGFCYYYYWFAGHRLLERPIENMLATGKPDFPFCLCWANENWTRRWDGQEHDVLMAQQHSDEDDVAVIRDLIRYFRSPHYIRVNGKPLILVYRITLFPDFARTAAIWRQVCRDEGIGDIYIAQVESFELVSAGIHPKQLGCDAAVEFPPQGMAEPRPVSAPLLNPEFQGAVADYRDLAVRYATRDLPAYKRFMGVMPGWDNTARRQNHSYSFENATPGAFQAWLETTITRTKQQYTGDERLIFINAWNEWAEGAYLEPDRRFGHTFLEALRNARDSDHLIRKTRYFLG